MKACSQLWDFICKLWSYIRKLWMIDDEKPNPEVDEIKLIQMAGEEVSAARNLFSRADDPDMVDWAIYSLTAAEKRYNYLFKKYKQKNYKPETLKQT